MRSVRKSLAGRALAAGALAVWATSAAAAPVPDAEADPARALAAALAFDEPGPVPTDAASAEDSNDASARAEPASEVVEKFARWVTASGDHGGQSFAIIDKLRARVFVYAPDGRLSGSAPALIGSALGDDSAPGVGELALASIPRDQRTTPAGRFEAVFGPAEGAFAEVLWIDYAAAVSLHPVITTNARQRRVQRLASATPLDNRITFGCVNVPAAFYDEVIRPAFADARAIVYVLPETRELEEVFPDLRLDGPDGTVAAAVESERPKPRLKRAGKTGAGEGPRRPRDDALDLR